MIGFPERIGWGFTVNGAYTLPLLILPGMLWAYRKRSPLAIALYVPLAVWWVVLQPVAWHATEQSVYVVGAVGAALLLLAEAHRPGDPMGVPFRFWGTAVSAGVLVPLGFARRHSRVAIPAWVGSRHRVDHLHSGRRGCRGPRRASLGPKRAYETPIRAGSRPSLPGSGFP